MNRFALILAASIMPALAVGAGCDFGPKRVRPPAINAAAAGAAAVRQYDANGDGKISGNELDKCPSLRSCAAVLDPKGKEITAEMIQSLIEQWAQTKIGRRPGSCVVLHNGKPLADATVTFVPEDFLGSNVPRAKGRINAKGQAAMTVEDGGPTGIPMGFYRVEVVKDGENIPAKYNTDTELGAGVIGGGVGLVGSFNLKY
jgi:hypothetical protein